jgi:hypothetical protein
LPARTRAARGGFPRAPDGSRRRQNSQILPPDTVSFVTYADS